ncbi:MAG: DinB family protein [Ignavibacteriae bacterium]|nr:DinB family protein [Ignavibacteriota bacterium]
MIRSIEDFNNAWKYESESTVKVFDHLTQESLDQRVTPEGRSLGFLAWHIITTLTEMPGSAGLAVEGPQHGTPAPDLAEEFSSTYRSTSEALVKSINENWNDEMLTDTLTMYGQDGWTYGMVLRALIDHQIHHRGQMTVLMRQAGLRVPGVYGPAREDWASMGMEAMP